MHFSTVGLSGVVTGMIGLFAFLLPHGRIRCYYWFVIFIGSVAVPAWALALWYIGGDIYKLFAYDDHGIVNVMAHVSGGIAGYLFGANFPARPALANETSSRKSWNATPLCQAASSKNQSWSG